jgi:glucose-1-phosphate thymidylyltransferase
MSAVKAVVLARGLGTRMREQDEAVTMAAAQADAADQGVKAMMPLDAGAGADRPRPFLDYVLSALADAGYTDVCLVIGPPGSDAGRDRGHDRVRARYTDDAPPRRVRVAFAVQEAPRGTADAMLAAEAFAGADDVLVINGDNYYPVPVMRALRELDEPGTVLFDPDGLARNGNIAPDRIRAFAVGALTEDGYLADIVEKPDEETMRTMARATQATAGRTLVSMNCWRLPPAIFDACRDVRPSPRGELELTQAIRDAVRTRGLRIKVLTSDAGVLDLSRRGDIATVTARLRGVRVDP